MWLLCCVLGFGSGHSLDYHIRGRRRTSPTHPLAATLPFDEQNPHTFRMTRLNAITPQLKVLDQMFEGYNTLDVNNAAPFLSKNYIHMSFPKIADLPDLTKEEHLKVYGPMFAKLVKHDVRILHYL